jgi:hypothetical protein
MPVIQKSSIDDAVERYVAESRYTMQERPGVVWANIRKETLPTGQGGAVNIPKYGTVNTAALTEGIDMAQAQEINDTGLAITPAEFGAQVVLTDMMLITVKDEFFRVAGRILGDSFDRQREQTLCDDMDNFSVALGSAGTALNVGHAMASYATIKYNAPANASAGRGGEPGPDPVYLFVTPSQIHSLRKTMVGGIGAAANTQVAPDLTRTQYQDEFMVGGVNVRGTINFSKDTNDDVKGGALSKEALIGVQLGAGPSAEKERDASLRAWEVNFVGRWARAEYNDAWGREMLFDSALPTS